MVLSNSNVNNYHVTHACLQLLTLAIVLLILLLQRIATFDTKY